MENLNMKKDPNRKKFYFPLDHKEAFIKYEQPQDNLLKLTDTFVPEKFRSQGVASELAHQVLEYSGKNNYELIISCPYLKSYLKRHPEYEKLLVDEEIDQS